MYETVKMSAVALRRIAGKSFDYEKFEQGRHDTRIYLTDHPEEKEEELAKIKCRLENCDFAHTPGLSYWIGCLCETDFI